MLNPIESVPHLNEAYRRYRSNDSVTLTRSAESFAKPDEPFRANFNDAIRTCARLNATRESDFATRHKYCSSLGWALRLTGTSSDMQVTQSMRQKAFYDEDNQKLSSAEQQIWSDAELNREIYDAEGQLNICFREDYEPMAHLRRTLQDHNLTGNLEVQAGSSVLSSASLTGQKRSIDHSESGEGTKRLRLVSADQDGTSAAQE